MPRGGGSRRERLKRALDEQKRLEEQLKRLNEAEDPNDSAKQIIQFIENCDADPMLSEDNPFKVPPPNICSDCKIL